MRFASNTLDLVNTERERRVADVQYQQMAKANAQRVSSLLRTAYQENKCKSLSVCVKVGLPQ